MSSVADVSTRRAAPVLGAFESYLPLGVALCIIAGIALGQMVPGVFHGLGSATIAQVNLPVAALVWLMIVPMLLKIDPAALREVGQHWRGIAADARLTSGCTRTELSRSLLPRDFDRRKFGPSWDAECAFATLEFSGYELAEDEQGRFFWRHRRDRRNVHCSRKQRKEIGAEDGSERRRS